MSTLQNLQSQSLPQITGQQPFSGQPPPPPPVPANGFPMLAVAVLGITATAFILVTYYIFVTNCCFRWQLIDPLSRLPIRRAPPSRHDDPLTSSPSPSWPGRGLDELLIREIPTVRYSWHDRELMGGSSKCVVCLNEFQDQEMLRVLPKCSHAFHLDCIDVWFLGSSSCPLCRSAISGRNRYRAQLERIVAPTSSPQGPHPSAPEGVDDFLEIVMSPEDETGGPAGSGSRRFLGGPRSQSLRKFEMVVGKSTKARKLRWVSVMGDEGIDVREKDGEEDGGRFGVEPIRRSFSMDSAVGPHVYQSVQEILRENQNREIGRARNNGEGGSRSRRSIFWHGRESRSAVLPV